MAHWQDRPEPRWKEFRFKQPYAKGLRRLREEVLARTDFDPATAVPLTSAWSHAITR